jgi:hypothetical protein
LGTISDEYFDVDNWVSDDGQKMCAAGWATRMKEFNKLGLKMVKSHNDYPFYDGYSCYFALDDFFGISHKDTLYIFCGKYNDNITKVRKRIKQIGKW